MSVLASQYIILSPISPSCYTGILTLPATPPTQSRSASVETPPITHIGKQAPIECLTSPFAEASHKHITAQTKTAQVRQETRARLLRAVQQTYEDVFERAQIVPGHMYQLNSTADQALDHTDQPLCDWTYLQQKLHLPHWLRVLFRYAPAWAAVLAPGGVHRKPS